MALVPLYFNNGGDNVSIEIKSTKGAVKRVGAKMLCVAESGYGKTWLAATTGKTIIISAEGSEMTLNDVEVDYIRVKSMRDLKEAYAYVKEHTSNYDTVVIDSLTEISEVIVSELKQDPDLGKPQNSMKLWMTYTDLITAIAKSFRDLDGINVLVLALPENVRVGMEDKVYPAMPAKKAQAKMYSLFDIVFTIRFNDEGGREFVFGASEDFPGKDRSYKLPATFPYKREEGLKPILKLINGE